MKLHNGWWILKDEDDDGYTRFSKEKGDWQDNLGQRAVYTCDNFEVAVDVGACYGAFSNIFAESFEKVISFEVHPDFVPPFWKNVEPHTNIELHNIGLWSCNKSGEVSRNSYGGRTSVISNVEHSTTHEWWMQSNFIEGGSDTRKVPVPTELRTLDSYNFEKIDLLKLDVEHSECHVIFGALETLARCKPVILAESSVPQNKNIMQFMLTEILNYQLVYRKKHDYIYRWRGDER